jgi:hypothetical protein
MTMAILESTTPQAGDVQLPASTETSPPTKFRERRLTVGDYSPDPGTWPTDGPRDGLGTATPAAPFLRLKGRWLDEAGFSIGSKVRVDVAPGRLVIETVPVIPERVPRLPRRSQKLFF